MERFSHSFCTYIPFKLYLKPAVYLAQDTHTQTHKNRHVWKTDYDISPFFFFPFRRLSGGTTGVPSPLRTMFCATLSANGPSVITVLLQHMLEINWPCS